MSRLSGAIAAVGLLASVVAQAPPAWQWFDLPDATATVLAVRWRSGFDLDAPGECGASKVLAECRLQRARAAVPGARASGVRVAGADAVAFVLVDAADWELAERFVLHLLDDALPLADDVIELAIARAALEADDAEWLYPGQALASLARTELLAGTSAAHGVAGDSRAIQRLRPARVRELLRMPTAAAGLGIGSVPAARRERLAGLRLPGPPGPRAAIAAPATARSGPLVTVPNARPKAPFVAAAFPVPAGVSLPALAVGLEVARARAARALPLRPEELLARAQRVQWSWLHGDPVVVFCLRGQNGRPVGGPRSELERLLTDLREAPPSAAECAAAAQALQAELGLPPWHEEQQRLLATTPEALPGRAVAALLAGAAGIGPGEPVGVGAPEVDAALRATLAAGSASWAAVVPPEPVRPPGPGAVR